MALDSHVGVFLAFSGGDLLSTLPVNRLAVGIFWFPYALDGLSTRAIEFLLFVFIGKKIVKISCRGQKWSESEKKVKI